MAEVKRCQRLSPSWLKWNADSGEDPPAAAFVKTMDAQHVEIQTEVPLERLQATINKILSPEPVLEPEMPDVKVSEPEIKVSGVKVSELEMPEQLRVPPNPAVPANPGVRGPI